MLWNLVVVVIVALVSLFGILFVTSSSTSESTVYIPVREVKRYLLGPKEKSGTDQILSWEHQPFSECWKFSSPFR